VIALRMIQNRIVSAKAVGRPTAHLNGVYVYRDGSGGDFRILSIEDLGDDDGSDIQLWVENLEGSLAGNMSYEMFCQGCERNEIVPEESE